MLSKLFVTSFAAAALAAPAPAPEPDVYHVPLARRNELRPRQDGAVDAAAFLTSLNATFNKYGAKPLPSYEGLDTTILKRASANEALTDQVETGVDELYYGPVQVGSSSPQTFTADFDTGSADFFVPGPSCGAAQGCVQGTKYNQGGTDEHNTTSVTYGSGSVMGENYFDTVSVAGLSTNHTNVISLTEAQGFNTSDSNSLLGLAFSTIANSKQPTFFENLISQGKISVPEFAFYLGRSKSGTQGNSELTFGGTDTSKYHGAVTKAPVINKSYWEVAVGGATVNGIQTLSALTSGSAAIDTGTTAIIAPLQAAQAIYTLIPGAFPVPLASGSPTEVIYAFPCGEKPSVAFSLGGKNLAVNPLDLSLGSLTSDFSELIGASNLTSALSGLGGVLSGGLCLGSIIGAEIMPVNNPTATNFYVLGDSFLKNWYSIYNYNDPSVSFAAATGNQ